VHYYAGGFFDIRVAFSDARVEYPFIWAKESAVSCPVVDK
jgi:hypothetical protein